MKMFIVVLLLIVFAILVSYYGWDKAIQIAMYFLVAVSVTIPISFIYFFVISPNF